MWKETRWSSLDSIQWIPMSTDAVQGERSFDNLKIIAPYLGPQGLTINWRYKLNEKSPFLLPPIELPSKFTFNNSLQPLPLNSYLQQ